ncbi:undecaprenyldiphospho-muramoylpentapeptide beta-N-acetylglucosaminyltransferase [Pseudomonadales bacterium]|nr:undecaprenyldiphospho-muramoylpentapeptide beta-N-acetylglucosaminyltransferase [Pseudomonadales bacterium]MDC1084619.1 undecaprenyldiphospho-muramoylpentapeptide beta-N-acetylglucosaminyltransferase [Pseudomonadales bacterium]
MKTILLTGGGTAGHVTPNLALIERFRDKKWDIHYVGSQTGIEYDLVGNLSIRYHAIATGKLRRYFSWQNFIDPLFILLGFFQSLLICLRVRPDVVFSKGGFVTVPVVIAAWVCRIPVICHESDTTPGLANKLSTPFCRYVCVTFPQTAKFLPSDKVVVTGSPVRDAITRSDPDRGADYYPAISGKPRLLVFGGSLGAGPVNLQVEIAVPELVKNFTVLHVVGTGNLNAVLNAAFDLGKGYRQVEFIQDEFGDVLAAADVVVSRAGANSIYELILLRKPHILVPLSASVSRGDQIENAKIFSAEGYSQVIDESELNPESLLKGLNELMAQIDQVKDKLAEFERLDSVGRIVALLEEQVV